MTVLELAKKSDVTPHAVRYYTRVGLLHPVSDPVNSYKRFGNADVKRLRFIRQAQSLGFTLKEIAQIFDERCQGKPPCPKVHEIIACRIKGNRDKLDELAQLQTRMEQVLAQWEQMPDKVPVGDTICHLIESFESEVQKP